MHDAPLLHVPTGLAAEESHQISRLRLSRDALQRRSVSLPIVSKYSRSSQAHGAQLRQKYTNILTKNDFRRMVSARMSVFCRRRERTEVQRMID